MINIMSDPLNLVLDGKTVYADCCGPCVAYLVADGDGPAFDAWLRDQMTWPTSTRVLLRSIVRSHRRGREVALRCSCPDRRHAEAVRRLALELAKNGGVP
jgi:hypothetical protein